MDVSLPYKSRMDRTEQAWAAGFFDAEGWAAAARYGRGDIRRPIAQINQADAFGVPEVLGRFRAAVGVGRISGPQRAPGKIDLYRWVASSRADVGRTFEELSPWLGPVKVTQFENATGAAAPPVQEPRPDEALAWAAGLFDGDGSTCLLKHRTHTGYICAEMSITQTSRTGAPEVLTRFRAIVELGHVNGPFGGSDRCEPVFRWKAHRLADIAMVAQALWPWLGHVKRAQAERVVAAVSSQPPLPRGNPAWGNRKTHCVNGHEYASARMRPFVPRRGGSELRPSKYCLACLREHARRQRARSYLLK